MYRAWQISSLGYKSITHWVEILFSDVERRWVHTSNVTFVTYQLMMEDERQRKIFVAEQNKAAVHDPDAETKARFRAKGRDFDREMADVKLAW